MRYPCTSGETEEGHEGHAHKVLQGIFIEQGVLLGEGNARAEPPWRRHEGKWHLSKVETPLECHLNQVAFLDASTFGGVQFALMLSPGLVEEAKRCGSCWQPPMAALQGYLAHKKEPTPLGPP